MSTEIPSQTGASEVVGNGASSELDSTNLATFRERRLAEIDALRTNGVNPYPYRFDRTHTLGEIRATHGTLEAGTETTEAVAITGRIMLKRNQGKLMFLTVRDRSDDIQLFVSKSVVGDAAFDSISSLDLGDWVGAH
ncbi:MAG: OB-fold nucleic acid binding domain-containing protein, partial [Ilumatobacteraceae bacterium]